jgi:hypothetical protein
MSERFRGYDDATLGYALASLADDVAWPSPPDVAQEVMRSIRDRERHPSLARPRLSLPSRRWTLVLAIATVLLVAGVAIAAKLVIDLGALTVELVPGRPTSLPSLPSGGTDFGRAVTLEEAADIVGFTPSVPQALGPPDRVWVDEAVSSFETSDRTARVVMAWRPNSDLSRIPGTRWGAVLMEFDGEANVATKIVYEETGSLHGAIVDGRSAFWTTGPHELDLLGPNGVRRYLVTGNVLLWDEAGQAARLETVLGKHAAIQIAESID